MLGAQMTQAEFAKAANISQSNLNQIENGKTGYTQERLERIADSLNVSPAVLLSVNPLDQPIEEEQDNFDQRDEPRFVDVVTGILAAMEPATRSLALDLLKTALSHEKLLKELDVPRRLKVKEYTLAHKFDMS